MLRSAKRVLGFGSVFPTFIAVAYAAGGRTALLTLSAISKPVIRLRLVFGASLMELGRQLNW